MKVSMVVLTVIMFFVSAPAVQKSGVGASERAEAYVSVSYHLHSYNFDRAEALCRQYLEKDPGDPWVLTALASILQNVRNEKEQASVLLKTALSAAPDYYLANALLASTLYMDYISDKSMGKNPSRERLESAFRHLETALKDNESYYDAVFLSGAVLSELGQYEKAAERLEKAATLKLSAEPWFHLIELYRKIKNTDKEMEAHRNLLELNPGAAASLNALAQHHLNRNEPEEAAEYLERLHQKYPNEAAFAIDYLYTLFAMQDADRFLEISEKTDISSAPLLVIAKAWFLGRKEQVDPAINLLLTLKNPDLRAKLLLADLYKQKNDYYKAYEILNLIPSGERNHLFYSLYFEVLSILDMNQRSLAIFNEVKTSVPLKQHFTLRDYYNLMASCCDMGDIAALSSIAQLAHANLGNEKKPEVDELLEIISRLNTHQTVSPSSVSFDLNTILLLRLYKKKALYGEAASLVSHWISRDKNNTLFHYLELAEIYLRQKDRPRLDELIHQMENLFPDSHEIKNFHAYYLAMENRDLDTALKLSRDTLDADAENAAYLDTHGYILLRLGRGAESRPFLEKAYAKLPFEKEIIEHLADCYLQANLWDKADEIFRRAIDNGVDFREEMLLRLRQLDAHRNQVKNEK